MADKKPKKKTVFSKDIAFEFICGGAADVAEKIKSKAYSRAHIEDAAKFLRGPPVNSGEKAEALLALLPAKRPTNKVFLSADGVRLRRAARASDVSSIIRLTVSIDTAPDGSFWTQEEIEGGGFLVRPYSGPVVEKTIGEDDDDDAGGDE